MTTYVVRLITGQAIEVEADKYYLSGRWIYFIKNVGLETVMVGQLAEGQVAFVGRKKDRTLQEAFTPRRCKCNCGAA